MKASNLNAEIQATLAIVRNVAQWRKAHKVHTLTPEEIQARREAAQRHQRWHIHNGRITSIGQALSSAGIR